MLLRQLLEDKNIPVRQAVIYTLLERYFKRVASHLDNIASAVLNPVSDIDMDAK
jgi:phosphate uptake regulator